MEDRAGLEDDSGFGTTGAGGTFGGAELDSGAGATSSTSDGDSGAADPTACVVTENLTEYLDGFQVPGDDHVLFCHGTGGGGFVLVDSSISSCFPHLDHRWDVFPSTGCDS